MIDQLASKGVKSVKSRVTNIKPYMSGADTGEDPSIIPFICSRMSSMISYNSIDAL